MHTCICACVCIWYTNISVHVLWGARKLVWGTFFDHSALYNRGKSSHVNRACGFGSASQPACPELRVPDSHIHVGTIRGLPHLPGIYLDAEGFKLLSSCLPCKFAEPSSQTHITTFEPRCGILSGIPVYALRGQWPAAQNHRGHRVTLTSASRPLGV